MEVQKRQGLAVSLRCRCPEMAIPPHLRAQILKMTPLTAPLSVSDSAERLSSASNNVSESSIVPSTTLQLHSFGFLRWFSRELSDPEDRFQDAAQVLDI